MGVPNEHVAIGQAGSGALIFFLPWAHIGRNLKCINYMWYNQHCFMNYTIQALDLIQEQLHATSTMALQNRIILDIIRAPDEGVCTMFKDQYCTYIPMQTGVQKVT